jgi:ligand-binding SRPBCC domain-containing protein
MARIEENVDIKRSVDIVFAYQIEAKNWPKWWSFIPEAEQTCQGPIGVGTTFKGTIHILGITMKWTAKATEYESNMKWVKNITAGSTIIEEHMTFDPIEIGTRFTVVFDMKVGGLMKLFSPMIVSSMRKETRKSLGNLKNILEAQT